MSFTIGQFRCICLLWFPLSTRFMYIWACSLIRSMYESINAHAWFGDSVQRKIIAYDSFASFFRILFTLVEKHVASNDVKTKASTQGNTRTYIHTSSMHIQLWNVDAVFRRIDSSDFLSFFTRVWLRYFSTTCFHSFDLDIWSKFSEY